MKTTLISCLLFIYSLLGKSADKNNIKNEQSINFVLNIPMLEKGLIQYHTNNFDSKAFVELPKHVRALDLMNYHTKSNAHVLLYKYAYYIPINTNLIFDENLYAKKDYIAASHSSLASIEIDKYNPMLQTHAVPLPKIPGMGSHAIYSVHHAELESKTVAAWFGSSLQSVFEELREKQLATPRVMVTNNLDSNQKLLLGGLTIASFYPFNGGSLAVVYKIAVLRPKSIRDKLAFNTGIAQLFMNNEEQEILNSVEASRRYLTKFRKDR